MTKKYKSPSDQKAGRFLFAIAALLIAVLEILTAFSLGALGKEKYHPTDPGDVNGDGIVDENDLALLGERLGIDPAREPQPVSGLCVHDYRVETVGVTCTESGTATYTCTKCGYSYSDTVAALGHDFSAGWIVTAEAAKYSEGEQHHLCARCGLIADVTSIPSLETPKFTYTVNADGSGCTVTGLEDTAFLTFTVPAVIDGYAVTDIGETAFDDLVNLQRVTLSAGIKNIGRSSFYGCKSLRTVVLPEGFESIGYKAFYGCSALETITLPASLTGIGGYAFYGCSALRAIAVPDGVTSLEKNTFTGCSALETVTVGAGVQKIGGSAFSKCSAIVSFSFNGTSAQWDAVTKESGWNTDCPDFTVNCIGK